MMENKSYDKDISRLHRDIRVTSASALTVLLTILLLIAAIIVWLFAGSVSEKAFANGLIYPENGLKEITLPYGGVVREVYVEEGEKVHVGQSIAMVSVDQAYSVVSATSDGIVFASKRQNETFEPFEPIMSVVGENIPAGDLMCVAYVDFDNVKDIEVGQEVQMWPSNRQKDEVGYVRGTVSRVSAFQQSANVATSKMGISDYTKNLIPDGDDVFQVEVDLSTDKNNPDAPDWTFKSDSHPAMTPGTICNVVVITKRMSVFSQLFMNGRSKLNKVKGWLSTGLKDSSTDVLSDSTSLELSDYASKGRVMSKNIVPVSTPVDGFVSDFSLVEGQSVKAGQRLLKIDDSDLKMEIAQAESELEKKRFDYENTLVGMGYSRDELASIPADVRHNVEVLTGYNYALVSLDNMKQRLQMYEVKAPFNGKVLNIATHRYAWTNRGDILFYVMDAQNLVVEFKVLESQLSKYTLGMELEFSTVAGAKYTCKLTSIAPNVEQDGMKLMSADIISGSEELVPGMTAMIKNPSEDEAR